MLDIQIKFKQKQNRNLNSMLRICHWHLLMSQGGMEGANQEIFSRNSLTSPHLWRNSHLELIWTVLSFIKIFIKRQEMRQKLYVYSGLVVSCTTNYMYCSLIILLLLVSQAEVTFQINPLNVTLHPQRMFLVLDNASAGRWSLISCSCCCLLTMFCSGGGSKGVFLPLGLHSPAAGGMSRSPESEEQGRGHHHCSWLWIWRRRGQAVPGPLLLCQYPETGTH